MPINVLFFLYTVDAEEIRRLGKRFKKLDLDNSGSISTEEFMILPELQQNPLVQRVIDIFDEDRNGEVDFKGKYEPVRMSKWVEPAVWKWEKLVSYTYLKTWKLADLTVGRFVFVEFIQGVSQFSVKGDKESKLRFAFRIYDMDNDGYISNGELFQVSARAGTWLWDNVMCLKGRKNGITTTVYCRYLRWW